MAKTCGSCGLVVTDDVQRCEQCGYQFGSGPNAETPVKGRSGLLVPLTLSVLIAFPFLFIIGLNVYQTRTANKERAGRAVEVAAAPKRLDDAVAKFNNISPAQHLEQAEPALRTGSSLEVIRDGLRHVKAVPASAPEAPRAKALERRLLRAQNLGEAERLLDASSSQEDLQKSIGNLQEAMTYLEPLYLADPPDKAAVKLFERLQVVYEKKTYVSHLNDDLKEIGFNVNVWEDGAVLHMNCELFRDTEYRVEFLAGLRSYNRNLCKLGYRQIRLYQHKLVELGTTYSLNCP